MQEIKGKINTAISFAKIIEDGAVEQIRRMCDFEFTQGSNRRLQKVYGRHLHNVSK